MSNNAYYKRYKEKHKSLGLCLDCSEKAEVKGRCKQHYERKLIQTRKAVQKLYQTRRNSGICVSCSNPSIPDQTRCEVHAKLRADRLYKKRKKFGRRRADIAASRKQAALKDLKSNIGIKNWTEEVDRFFSEHSDLFVDKNDRILQISIPLFKEGKQEDETWMWQ